jgi:hypothetical protein
MTQSKPSSSASSPLSVSAGSVAAASQSAAAGLPASVVQTLPTEPHPNPNPTPTEFQKQALAEWETEGGQGPDYGVTYEQISLRAYEIYQESGCIEGRCEENWYRAEQELREKAKRKSQPDKG